MVITEVNDEEDKKYDFGDYDDIENNKPKSK